MILLFSNFVLQQQMKKSPYAKAQAKFKQMKMDAAVTRREVIDFDKQLPRNLAQLEKWLLHLDSIILIKYYESCRQGGRK